MGTQVPDNSLNHLQLDCEIYMTNQDLEKKQLPPSDLIAMHAPNPLDTLDLSDKNNSIDLRLHEQKDNNICTVSKWLKKTTPPSPYISNELSKYLNH